MVLQVLGIRVNHEEGACQFLVFLSYACSFLSVWYTVCITIENYIAICHPTKVNVFCTRSRALIVVTLLACGSLVVYITSAAATEVRADKTGQRMCERKGEPFMSVMKALSIFDSVVTLLLPLVCVTIMLVAIVLSIINTYRWRRSSPGSQKRRAELMDIPQVRVAKMLFALSLSYVIMNLPSHVSRLYYMINDMIHTMGGGGGGGTVVGAGESHMLISQEASLVQLVLLFGSYLYYAVKFILFLTFSKNFRRSIRETCIDSTGNGSQKRNSAPTAV